MQKKGKMRKKRKKRKKEEIENKVKRYERERIKIEELLTLGYTTSGEP